MLASEVGHNLLNEGAQTVNRRGEPILQLSQHLTRGDSLRLSFTISLQCASDVPENRFGRTEDALIGVAPVAFRISERS